MRVATKRRHMLPHERFAVSNLAARNMFARNHRLAEVARKNGPEGVTLWSAALGNMWFGFPLCIVSVVLITSGGGYGTVAAIGERLLPIVLIFGILYVIRAVQCAKAGRAFRAERRNVGPGLLE